MCDERAFDLGVTEPVARDIDDIVDATGDPVIAFIVAAATIACKILAGIGLEVCIDEPLMVAVHRAHLSRPRVGNTKIAACGALLHFTLGVHDRRLHAKERFRRRAWLESDCAGQWRDEDSAGLGLPPRIDDRATTFSDNAVVPLPCLRVDRLTR